MRARARGYDEPTTRLMCEQGNIRGVRVVGQGAEWITEIQVGTGSDWSPVITRRGNVRSWKSLDTVTGWLRDSVGVSRWSVDADAYAPGQLRAAV